MALAVQLPPRFLAPSLARQTRGVLLSTVLPLGLAELLNDVLLRIRGGGRKHQHPTVRKRAMDSQKLFKEQKHIDNCQACGRPKLVGHMCIHCVTYLTQLFKATKRAGLDRPTLDDKGLFITAPHARNDIEERQHVKSVEAREAKYKKLKEEYEAAKLEDRKRKNARRKALGLPELTEDGKVPVDGLPQQRVGMMDSLRAGFSRFRAGR